MNDAIGGYFELELRKGEHYHKDAIRLNTARNCLEYILKARGYKKIYIPYYTCEVILEPIQKLGISYEFYHINYDLEPEKIPMLKTEEAFLYTNYFGLKQSCVERLSSIYGNQLIVDNAQAFYAKRIDGIDTFYSPRKFFGVPDGGYLYTDCRLDNKFAQDKSCDRMHHLLVRMEDGAEAGYNMFKEEDASLCNSPIKNMSLISDRLLRNIDYLYVKDIRRNNFRFLHVRLSEKNKLKFNFENEDVPLIYPYLQENINLKTFLISKRIFVATYWPNVFQWNSSKDIEYKLAQGTVFLPIDQRYEKSEMEIIVKAIKQYKHE